MSRAARRDPRSVMRRFFGCAVAGVCFLALSGCLPGYVRISVSTHSDINQKQPVYMLVRTLEKKDYLGETYADVVSKMVEQDASLLSKELLFPGKSRTIYLKQPKKGALALYFLFTAPGGTWRLFIEPPLPLQLKAELRGNILVEKATTF